ncbi:hypothetical protein [Klenkia soli]|uniref:hypothetical protein n=1 Tax=Klenkia soli TaxID=1052260 RepID=UPI0010420994|nr:hypothetical protein [Klenkia soli]
MPGQPAGAYPALLHAWQQDEDGQWWGRVTYSTPRELGPAVVDTWVQAGYLAGLDTGLPPSAPGQVDR